MHTIIITLIKQPEIHTVKAVWLNDVIWLLSKLLTRIGSSLFSVGKREGREIIWKSGTQEKKPMRKFATEINLMLSNDGSMKGEHYSGMV